MRMRATLGQGTMTIWLAALAASGCSGSAEPPRASPSRNDGSSAPASVPLEPVRLPDLSAVAAPVRTQITSREASLRAGLGDASLAPADRARLYADLGHVLLASTFFDEAILCYRHAAALEPTEPGWSYLLGHAALRKGDRDAAALAFERTTLLRPSYVPALVWLGDMHLDRGQTDAARAAFDRAVAQEPDSAAARFGAGRAAMAARDYAAAVAHFEQALRTDPTATAIHYPLAMAYRQTGQGTKAEALLQRRGTVAPAMADPLLQVAEVVLDSAVSHEAVGMQALRRQDWAGAIQAFRRGLEVAPGDPSLRYWMASAMIASGDAAGAEREFTEVVRQHPDYARAHFSLGAIADQRGRHQEALQSYAAAVRHAPNMPDARLRLAESLRAAGRTREAMEHYEAAVSLDPGAPQAWLGGAQALLALGDRAKAADWLARGRRLHPAHPALARLQADLGTP